MPGVEFYESRKNMYMTLKMIMLEFLNKYFWRKLC